MFDVNRPSFCTKLRGFFCRCPPDKGDPPEGGRGFAFAVVPLTRGIPPKGGGGCFCRCPPDKGESPEGGRGVAFAVVPLIRGIPPKGGGGFVFAVVPLTRGIPPKGGGGFAVVPLTRGIPPKGGGGFFVRGSHLRASTSRKGGGLLLVGVVPLLPFGKKTPLNPPLSGGQKALPLRGRLASLSGRKPPLIPLIREVCCRCPPDKGDPPEGGRGFCRCPPDKGDTPEGGRGFCFLGSPLLPFGKKTPLNPPLSGGQKALPLIRGSPPKGGGGCFCCCPPDKGDPPEGGRGFAFAVVPLIRGIPPKGGGGFFVRGSHLRASTSRKGGGLLLVGVVPLLPYREENPP